MGSAHLTKQRFVMCGRFTLRTKANVMIKQFSLKFEGELIPRYNIAPTQLVPVVRTVDREMNSLRWGLIPFWAKSPRDGAKMINARAETVATKPAFRNAIKTKRCLVPADGYFEWVREGKQKQPYWIRMKDEQPFLMAGLWERWRDKSVPDAEPIETFTILTTTANKLTADIHDRMPVIVSPNDYEPWLDTSVSAETLSYMYEPFSAEDMRVDLVNPRVNSVRNDDEDCVRIERTLF